MQNQAKSTIDPEEIERFSRIADEWWDPRGKFAPLHRINPLRLSWIGESIRDSGFSAQGTSLLDVGCGGGLIAEPLAAAGLTVTGIDASEKNIAVAKLHAQKSDVTVDYRCRAVENLNENFDVVTALEIVEHVADVPAFVAATCARAKPGGLVFFSTINRTAKSYALAIVGAEYVLRWLPRGTHTWSKFIKPHELVRELEKNGIEILDLRGMVMNPLTFEWRWVMRDLSVNYALVGRKK